jgi:hypothetical protein
MTMAQASLFRTLMVLAAAALAASLLILMTAGEPVQAAPGAKGKIALASDRAGNLDIWCLCSAGWGSQNASSARGQQRMGWKPEVA